MKPLNILFASPMGIVIIFGMSNETERVKRLVDEIGLVPASKRLGLGHTTITRLAHGLAVRPGTLALLREKLAELDADGGRVRRGSSKP